MSRLSKNDHGQQSKIHERLKVGLSRREMSIRSLHRAMSVLDVPGSGYASVHAYVNGDTTPRRDWLMAAADVLGVRVEWLADGEGECTSDDQAIALRNEQGDGSDVFSHEHVMHQLLGNLLAGYQLPLEVRQAVYTYLWRRFSLRARATKSAAQGDDNESRTAGLRDLENEIEEFLLDAMGPALKARNQRPSEYAAALFAQLSVLYLTQPPEQPDDAD